MIRNGWLMVLAVVVLFVKSAAGDVAGADAFRPGAVWADVSGTAINAHGGGILYDKGVYYWFGEHKIEGKAGNVSHVGVHVYSSTNLYQWQDEGIALPMSDVQGSPVERGCVLERPKVIFNPATQMYVMWFHLELKGLGYSAAYAGVAVANKVKGPYRFLRAGRVNAEHWPQGFPVSRQTFDDASAKKPMQSNKSSKGMDPATFIYRDFHVGQMARDMTLFVDEDGKAYHVYTSEENATLHIAELDSTFTRHTGRYWRAFEGRHMEAPAICKHKGKYYLIMSGCTGWRPNDARSAVAPSITGPWTELRNPCVGEKSARTFDAQGTFILQVHGKPDTYVFMADRWCPSNAIDGRYVWLPLTWRGDQMEILWHDTWQY